MILQRKLATAKRILSEEGFLALLQATYRHIASMLRVNEVRLAYRILQADQTPGIMIDIGAHYGSALLPFADSNWRIFAFEPDSENRTKLVGAVEDLPNVRIDPRAVSDQVQTDVTLYRSEVSTGISGLSSFHASHQAAERVTVTTLEQFLDEQGIADQTIDFLKIDTEGFDLNVLKGVAWGACSPRVILCEFEDAKTTPLGYTFHDLAHYLVAHGYRLVVSEWYPVKEYGGAHKWRRFASYPCELKDSGGWGNILAVREADLYDSLLRLCKLPG